MKGRAALPYLDEGVLDEIARGVGIANRAQRARMQEPEEIAIEPAQSLLDGRAAFAARAHEELFVQIRPARGGPRFFCGKPTPDPG